jgi:hypothetical protein
MRRIAWILLAVICSAFARVQPVDIAQCGQCACCHCKVPGDCGMPCSRTPAPAMFAVEPGALVPRPATREAKGVKAPKAGFFASFVESATDRVAPIATVPAVHAAGVPLFRAHCSFLI